MDCIVLPSDETNGELVHHNPNQILDFRGKVELGLFAALDGLLDRIVPEAAIPKADIRMTIGRRNDEATSFFHFGAASRYPPTVPEAEVWILVNAVFKNRLQERGRTDETPTA